MERLAEFDLHKWTKEALIDLLEEHPNLFEMTANELNQLVRDKYWTAQGYVDRANKLEIDASAIERYCETKFGEEII